MIFCIIVFGVAILFLAVLVLNFDRRERELEDENEILKDDNKYLRRKLREAEECSLYLDMGYDPIECEKHHYPGDCPLCGGV